MRFYKLFPANLLAVLAVVLLAACTDASTLNTDNGTDKQAPKEEPIELTVYKSRSCKCCQKWVSHIEENGFEANVNNIARLSNLKDEKGIAANYRSCHTAESADGYVFEGHVPAKFIKQYLDKVPAGTIGLSVPAMPVGTPGMEVGDRFMPYHVLLLNEDGTSAVYAEINTYEEQF